MTKKELEDLLQRYETGHATEEEKVFLESWYLQYGESDQLDYPLTALNEDAHSILANIQGQEGLNVRRTPWKKIAVAAVLFITLSISLYIYHIARPHSQVLAVHHHTEIVPGGSHATLILADGKEISLTDAKNGELARQPGIVVTKTADGKLLYKVLKSASSASTAYNTIKTPNGGQYQVQLPDGSNVWLNAASSIKYPVSFDIAMDRRIELDGEAYFEIAPQQSIRHKNKKLPFLVVTAHQTVSVLGTHFNVNAYRDEISTTTTLLEGSVKISNGQRQTILKPNQQAILFQNALTVNQADIEEEMAWKNGYFRFNNEKIDGVVRKLSRWYNVEFVFEGEMPTEGFNGVISRAKNLSQVLNLLEKTKAIHFKKEGRRIFVKP